MSDRELADLAFSGLRPYLKEKLEGIQFFSLAQIHQRASAVESRSHNIHAISGDSDDSDDNEANDVYAAELVWSDKTKPYVCTSLKPAGRSRREEFKFSFDITKCEIF